MITRPLALTLLAGLMACAPVATSTSSGPAGTDSRLVGTWELVSARTTNGSTVLVTGTAHELRALKILNGTDYSVVTRRGSEFLRAGIGRYTLAGATYTETVDLASGPDFIPGGVYTFQISVDGDTWTLDGVAGTRRLHEVWRRLR